MQHGASMITAVCTAALLATMGCGGEDGGNGATQTTAVLPDPVEVTYQCPTVSDQQESAAQVRVVEAGVCAYVDALGYVTYGLVVQNTSDQTVRDVIVDVEVHDSTGVSHGRSIPHHIYALAPGQRVGTGYYSVMQGTAEVVGIETDVNVAAPGATSELPEGEIRVSDVSTTVEGTERKTTFTLTSTYAEAFEDGLGLFVVYRNEAGQIVGGDDDFVTGLGPQEPVTHTVTSTYVNPTITRAEIYPNPDLPAQ